jgi:ATP phosphoribosyltransferase
MENSTLIIGMPAGSLADAQRGGNLVELLKDCGFRTSGYTTGGPSSFSGMSYLFGWDGRPQEFGSQLGINELDVAIAGDDWINERILELKLAYKTDIKLERVLSLNRGGVRIVAIAAKDNPDNISDILKLVTKKKKLITVATEMPYLALDWVRSKLNEAGLLEKYSKYSVQKYKTPPLIDSGVLIYETWGKTEAKVKNGGADLGVEITQSGSAIRNYDLNIVDEILHSETSIWINPEIKKDSRKKDLLELFLINLYGAVNAENKVMVLFNAPNNNAAEIEKYLVENNLFADEPTKTIGREYTEFYIQIDMENPKIPLAKVRYQLASLGAKHINTIPLSSSIPGIQVIR